MSADDYETIRITGVITEEVGDPRNDGTPGSGLYAVPFRLSRAPSQAWIKLFLRAWEMPARFTSMHRPKIASVAGDRIVLDGTTMEEVERYHLETLKLAVAQANGLVHEENHKRQRSTPLRERTQEEHRKKVREIASRLQF
jgi:hypothetical protein